MDIKILRQEIDALNVEILRLFEKRMELCRDIVAYKRENSLPVYDEKREKEVLDFIAGIASADTREYAVSLFTELMKYGASYQEKLVGAVKDAENG